ncbi:AAA domain-containing protein [Algibacter sp. TI.3.09]|uniref:AAA domain-containing protein n=1 Tax=Algibacter sp. TI.3.09 TaxID=3121298 RepID=UPI0031203A30
MILDTLKTNTTFIVEAKNLSQEKIPANGLLGFLRHNDINYEIFIEKKLYDIEILDKNKLDNIDGFFLNRNYTAIINIIESLRDDVFTLEIIFFAYPIIEIFEPFFISLGEKNIKTAKDIGLISKKDNIDSLSEKIKEIVSFNINGESYFLTSTAISSQQEIFEEDLNNIREKIEQIEEDKDEELKEDYKKRHILAIEKINADKKALAFTVHGENINVAVKKEFAQNGYKFTATKLKRFIKRKPNDSLRLIKGNIEFKNGLVSAKIADDLGDIVEKEGSYLNTWDKYVNEEGKLLIDKAKSIGVIEFIGTPELIAGGYNLKINNFPELKEILVVGDYLSMVATVPSYITDNLSWLEYIAQKEIQESINIQKDNVDSFEVTHIDNEFITIKTDNNYDFASKKIVLSIYGDEVQLERKFKARKRLLEGKSANPLLGLLIEDTDKFKQYMKTSKKKVLEPLTEVVKNKIFSKNPPTENQIDAIDMALNTPDIAIIQGPPGTGKTTVLAAIIERLNDVSDKENIRGQVLVAGFQHDAVENIIQRLDINGIPTPKFGKKSTSTVDISSYERVMEWSNDIASNLTKPLTKLTNYNKINKLNKSFEVYLKTPSKTRTIELLNFIVYELSAFLKEDIVADAQNLLKSLSIKQIDNVKELQQIYSLRTTAVGFMDDGVERNLDLKVSNIGKLLRDDEKGILNYNNLNDLENYLPKLQKLKYNLIDRFYPKPIFKAEKPNSDIINLKDRVESQLSNSLSTKDRINVVLANYINELESNPFGLKSMIEEYSYVFSSTTGQSSKASYEKGGRDNEDVVFDTLIIDEAARVAPMDLLLAMVLAKKRIILVGDHRQLPHMVDDKIIKSANLNENDFIKESMFGYLKLRAKKLKEHDNITREITLENQFRTHPLLGKFISDNFYLHYGEAFKSPRVEQDFHQNLKGIENIPAVWIDVPNDNNKGKEKRGEKSRSWSRESEVEAIIEYLGKWILSKQGKYLTFGVITFYGDQVKELERKIYRTDGKGTFSIEEQNFFKERLKIGTVDSFQFKERLKIGTVDSFQGMEFDIVFLSVVRSLSLKSLGKAKSPFGHLASKNRLCVSMSRQEKSLIVVGDKEFFESERAKSEVKELNNFLQVCINKGKVL